MNNFLLEQLQKYAMLFDITTDQLIAWVGDWKKQVPELYNPNFQIFSIYAFWGADIYLLWAIKKQTLTSEEQNRLEELETIYLRAETKAEIATHLFPEKVISELSLFTGRVAKWWQGEYSRKLNQLKAEDKKSELKSNVAYILYRREQMFFAALAMERQCLRGTAKLVADLKSMTEFLVDPAIKSLCQKHQYLFKGNANDIWFPEEFWWREICPFQEWALSLSVSIEKKTTRKESWLDFLDENGGDVMKEELWKLLYARASELHKTVAPDNEEEWAKAKKIAEMAMIVAEETFEKDNSNLKQSSLLVKNFGAKRINCVAPTIDDKVLVRWGESYEELADYERGKSGGYESEALYQLILQKANECYDKATQINRTNITAWLNKGLLLCQLNQYNEAIKYYNEVLKINPNDNETWKNEGDAFYALDEFDEAIECYEEALHIDSSDSETWKKRVNALRAARRSDPWDNGSDGIDGDYEPDYDNY